MNTRQRQKKVRNNLLRIVIVLLSLLSMACGKVGTTRDAAGEKFFFSREYAVPGKKSCTPFFREFHISDNFSAITVCIYQAQSLLKWNPHFFTTITSFHSRAAADGDIDHRAGPCPHTQASRYRSRRRPSGLSVCISGFAPHEAQGQVSSIMCIPQRFRTVLQSYFGCPGLPLV